MEQITEKGNSLASSTEFNSQSEAVNIDGGGSTDFDESPMPPTTLTPNLDTPTPPSIPNTAKPTEKPPTPAKPQIPNKPTTPPTSTASPTQPQKPKGFVAFLKRHLHLIVTLLSIVIILLVLYLVDRSLRTVSLTLPADGLNITLNKDENGKELPTNLDVRVLSYNADIGAPNELLYYADIGATAVVKPIDGAKPELVVTWDIPDSARHRATYTETCLKDESKVNKEVNDYCWNAGKSSNLGKYNMGSSTNDSASESDTTTPDSTLPTYFNKISCTYFLPANTVGLIAWASGWNRLTEEQAVGCSGSAKKDGTQFGDTSFLNSVYGFGNDLGGIPNSGDGSGDNNSSTTNVGGGNSYKGLTMQNFFQSILNGGSSTVNAGDIIYNSISKNFTYDYTSQTIDLSETGVEAGQSCTDTNSWSIERRPAPVNGSDNTTTQTWSCIPVFTVDKYGRISEVTTRRIVYDAVHGNEVVGVYGPSSGLKRHGEGTFLDPYTLSVNVGDGIKIDGDNNVAINAPYCADYQKTVWKYDTGAQAGHYEYGYDQNGYPTKTWVVDPNDPRGHFECIYTTDRIIRGTETGYINDIKNGLTIVDNNDGSTTVSITDTGVIVGHYGNNWLGSTTNDSNGITRPDSTDIAADDPSLTSATTFKLPVFTVNAQGQVVGIQSQTITKTRLADDDSANSGKGSGLTLVGDGSVDTPYKLSVNYGGGGLDMVNDQLEFKSCPKGFVLASEGYKNNVFQGYNCYHIDALEDVNQTYHAGISLSQIVDWQTCTEDQFNAGLCYDPDSGVWDSANSVWHYTACTAYDNPSNCSYQAGGTFNVKYDINKGLIVDDDNDTGKLAININNGGNGGLKFDKDDVYKLKINIDNTNCNNQSTKKLYFDGTQFKCNATVNKVTAGAGLTTGSDGTAGGYFENEGTLQLADSGVIAKTYNASTTAVTNGLNIVVPQFTVDRYGRLTNASTTTVATITGGNGVNISVSNGNWVISLPGVIAETTNQCQSTGLYWTGSKFDCTPRNFYLAAEGTDGPKSDATAGTGFGINIGNGNVVRFLNGNGLTATRPNDGTAVSYNINLTPKTSGLEFYDADPGDGKDMKISLRRDCATNETLKWANGVWNCAPDNDHNEKISFVTWSNPKEPEYAIGPWTNGTGANRFVEYCLGDYVKHLGRNLVATTGGDSYMYWLSDYGVAYPTVIYSIGDAPSNSVGCQSKPTVRISATNINGTAVGDNGVQIYYAYTD